MRRSLTLLLTGGLLLLGSLALASGASAATIAPTTTCSNGVDNTGGLGLICDVTVVNTITTSGGSASVTVRECHGAAGNPQAACSTTTTVLPQAVTAVTQCNSSINGGGGTLRCSVQVTNDFIGLSPTATAASVDQCVGSGGGITTGCDPFPATTSGATITQCNGSANGGTLVGLTCTATGTESSAQNVTINQCNGAANGGGALVICSANVTSNAPAPSPSPTASPAPTGSPAPTPSPSPTASPAPTGSAAPTTTPVVTIPATSTAAQITGQSGGTTPLALAGLLLLVVLVVIATSRRDGDRRHMR
jgi:hypothetical protein